MALSRRDFLGVAALSPLAARVGSEPLALPKRPFGRTGLEVPILAFGCGSRFVSYPTDEEALAVLSRAIDLGMTYVDTAHSYGDGRSEERVGQLMPARRKEVILQTKLAARNGDEAKRQLDLSLKRLRTDHLEVVHVHALESVEDLAAVEAKGGVLEVLLRARDEKIVRCVGISGHADPVAMKTALERHDFDCVQMALNLARARITFGPDGAAAHPMGEQSYEALALPVANRKGLGVVAMKIFGQERLVGKATTKELIYYALSLPVSLATLGMPKPEMLEENVALARKFQPLGPSDMRRLRTAVPEAERQAFARFMRDHRDA